MSSASGGFALIPSQGLCSWAPLGLCPIPHSSYRTARACHGASYCTSKSWLRHWDAGVTIPETITRYDIDICGVRLQVDVLLRVIALAYVLADQSATVYSTVLGVNGVALSERCARLHTRSWDRPIRDDILSSYSSWNRRCCRL